MIRSASIIKILTTDYLAFCGWLIPLVTWIVYMVIQPNQTRQPSMFTFLEYCGAVTLAGLVACVWRITLIQRVVTDGLETIGTITNIHFNKDRGRIHFVYTMNGQKYAGSNLLHRVAAVKTVTVGQEILLMIDRNNPKSAFIFDLFRGGQNGS